MKQILYVVLELFCSLFLAACVVVEKDDFEDVDPDDTMLTESVNLGNNILASFRDEDYAKLVQPDVEGQEVDRSLITPMAKELREAGIQPHVMSKVAAIYRKVVDAEVQRAEAAREAKMKEARDKCLAEISEEEGKDFAAVYREHISKDRFLKNLVDHTELGCSPAFIRILALAGATLRVEKGAPASAAAGSSLHDTDQGVFEATVPKHLR